jgi:hypothetical protein
VIRISRVRAAAREWWAFLKPPPAAPMPPHDDGDVGCGQQRGMHVGLVRVIHNEVLIDEFQVSDIDEVPDLIEIAGRKYRATVHVGPFCRPAEPPLYLLLVEPMDPDGFLSP